MRSGAGGVNRHDDDAERFAAGLQQRYAGRQRRSVRRARYLAGLPAYGGAGAGRHSGETSALPGSGAQGYANATELADYLVAKGVPFREAHHIVGEAVVEAIRQGKPLEDLPLSELQKFSQMIGEDVYPILSLQSCLDKRAAKGGVSPQQVAQAIAFARARLG